ncbi:MAG: DUF4911 domain-containing protein [Desulfovibrio sp.]|nr:DUF4911 domain-containing protein [Desulfovibrio sp.]
MGRVTREGKILARLNRRDIAMFRFLLESDDNEALFSVLERDSGLVKISFYEGSRRRVLNILREISLVLPMEILPWPANHSRLGN